jgi:lipopolysaccharide export system protein LptC
VFRGVVFWQDFAQWRTGANNGRLQPEKSLLPEAEKLVSNLPPRAEQILREA